MVGRGFGVPLSRLSRLSHLSHLSRSSGVGQVGQLRVRACEEGMTSIDAIGEIEAIEIIIFKIKFRSDVENMIRLLLLIGK